MVTNLLLEDIKGNDLRLSDKIDLMKNKLSEANMFQESLEKVNDLSGGLKFYIQFSGIWKRVVTLLDSGASITCGSLQNHNNMSNFIEIPDKKHGIIDANGNKSWIRGRIKTDIIVCGNGADSTLIIKGIEIFLVDNVKWTKILIGKGDLEKLQVSPSAQLISKMKEKANTTIEEINVVIGEANYDADFHKKKEKINPKAFNSLRGVVRKNEVPKNKRESLKKLSMDMNEHCSKLNSQVLMNEKLWKIMDKIYDQIKDEKEWCSKRQVFLHDFYVLDSEQRQWLIEPLGDNDYSISYDGKKMKVWIAPPFSIPEPWDATDYKLVNFAFDALIIDAPWKQTSSNPTRGLALNYEQLTDKELLAINLQRYAPTGLIFMWVTNNKIEVGIEWLRKYKFKPVEWLIWMKRTSKGEFRSSQGNYFLHSKEICIVAEPEYGLSTHVWKNMDKDLILEDRDQLQSKKPTILYQMIERLLPSGKYGELFGRVHNLRNHWTTFGNEFTLHDSDLTESLPGEYYLLFHA